MNRFDNLSHPAVEVPLSLDEEINRFEIPQGTTLFFWTAIAIGTPERIPSDQSFLGRRLYNAAIRAQKQISWSISINGESISLLSDQYRADGYRGLAWWIAHEPIELPASVHIRLKTDGDLSTRQANQVVLWTRQGNPIPWGSTIESAIELLPSEASPNEFPTRKEQLWGRHTVYVPE